MSVRANADTPADAATARTLRRRGHRPLPHRAHVLRRRPHRRGARDDPGRRREGRTRARWPSCCRCSAAISSSCSRSWRACRSPSGCSIRRCTNSCRKTDAEIARGRQGDRHGRRPSCASAPWRCTRPTRCWAIAAAASASPTPEIYEMQARAIFEAAARRSRRSRQAPVEPEIMIPLVAHQEGARPPEGDDRPRRRRGHASETGVNARLHGRHHDRAAARRAARRRDRRNAPSSSPSAPTT